MDFPESAEVWHRVESELDRRMPHWRDQIVSMEQMPALERRESGGTWTDREVFEALVLSVLTNSVDWSKIERIRHELKDCFCEFDPVPYSKLNPEGLESLAKWFLDRRAGAFTLRKSLVYLTESSSQLLAGKGQQTIDAYIGKLYEDCGLQPIQLARVLGSEKSPIKLRGVGLPLAAEFLKNLGYDLAKPDRHICRAVGEFDWVEFRRWPDRAISGPSSPSEKEMVAVMETLEELARKVGKRTTFVDNTLWLFCAQSGLRASKK